MTANAENMADFIWSRFPEIHKSGVDYLCTQGCLIRLKNGGKRVVEKSVAGTKEMEESYGRTVFCAADRCR